MPRPLPPSHERQPGSYGVDPPVRSREPVFNLPPAILGAIVILAGIHVLRLLLDDAADFGVVMDFAVVPARWSVALGWATEADILAAAGGSAAPSGLDDLARYVLADGARPWTGLTYALLHGSWTHLLFNAVWLAAFGTPLARRLGPARLLALSAAASLGGALAHVLMHPLDVLPLVGASGAISGMMGAVAWFLFAPARPLPGGGFPPPHARARQTLPALLGNRRVVMFVVVWLATNYIFAGLAQPLGIADEGIAWEAHVGGFLTGIGLFALIDPFPPR